jgi:hypothetical protein
MFITSKRQHGAAVVNVVDGCFWAHLQPMHALQTKKEVG